MTETIAYLREFHFASVVLRLALAMLLGGCIGLERERKRRPADRGARDRPLRRRDSRADQRRRGNQTAIGTMKMIYATGDLHGNVLRFQPQYFPEQAEMSKIDYMIVCGDFGCVWNGDKSDDPQIDRLEALPFTVLIVDGNHENFDALNEYPVEEWHGGKVHKIRSHVIHLTRG